MKKPTELTPRRSLADQIAAVRSISALFEARLPGAVDLIKKSRGKIVVCGVGKSGHISAKIAATFVSLGIPAQYLHASEATHGDFGVIGTGDVLIAISKSGETKDVLRVAAHAQSHAIPVVSITAREQSALGKMSAVVLSYAVKHEGSPYDLAPMASTTASLVIGDLLATSLALELGFTKEQFADLHPGGSLGLQLHTVAQRMVRGAATLPVVQDTQTFRDAVKVINEKKLGITAVLTKDKKIIGAVTDGDVRRFVLSSQFDFDAPVKKMMTHKPKLIKETDSLLQALTIMEQHKITVLFVVDKHQHLVGMVHMHHIIENALT